MEETFKGNVQQANESGSIRIGVTKADAEDVGLEPGTRAYFKLVEEIDE